MHNNGPNNQFKGGDTVVGEVSLSRRVYAEEELETTYHVGWKSFLAITALGLANCCSTFTNTTNTIIKFQVMAVGGSDVAGWFANGNFLMTLAFGPILGSLSDRLGKKFFIVGGTALGIIGSCISASSSTPERIIGGNVLTGIANAGCIIAVAAVQEVVPNKLRPRAFGYTQTLNSIAALLGTYCAGIFVKYETWRWSYYFNAIAFLVAGIMTTLTYSPPPTTLRRQMSLQEIFLMIDYLGIILLSGSLAAIVIGLTWGGSTYAWNSATVVATLTVGCIGLLAFGVYEWRIKKDGLLDHRLFVSRNFPILLVVCAIDGMLLLGINVLYSQEIGVLFTQDSVRIAVILSPYLITSLAGCIPAGWLMAKTRSFRRLLIGSLCWCSLFTGLMALINPDRLNMAYAFSALFGIGTAVTTVVPIVALALSVPSYLLGTAGTLSVSCRALGGLVGVTIFTAIYDNCYASNLPNSISAAIHSHTADLNGTSADIVTSTILGALGANPNAPPAVVLAAVKPPLSAPVIQYVLAAITSATVESWRWVWVAIAAIIAANAVLACFTQSVKEDMTGHVESALEKSGLRREQVKGQIKDSEVVHLENAA